MASRSTSRNRVELRCEEDGCVSTRAYFSCRGVRLCEEHYREHNARYLDDMRAGVLPWQTSGQDRLGD